jgi:hypothetical protein
MEFQSEHAGMILSNSNRAFSEHASSASFPSLPQAPLAHRNKKFQFKSEI